MGLYTLGDKSFYFVHNPRTSGRYVRALIENTPSMISEYNQHGKDFVKGRDVAHLHYPLFEHYLPTKDIPQIAIVRNPIDRFVSCIRAMFNMHGEDYNLLMENEDDFKKFVLLHIDAFSFKNNWFLPQNRFIGPKTKFWKYEDGIDDNFFKWVHKNTGVKVNNNPLITYQKFKSEKDPYKYQLDDHIEKYIYNFYKDDYIKFGYEEYGIKKIFPKFSLFKKFNFY